jgi:membrane-bound lytic murein transglycosylase B
MLVRILLTVLCLLPGAAGSAENYSARQEVREFIGEMVDKHGFSRQELDRLFSHIRRQPQIIRAMTPPPGSAQRSWHAYRSMFVNARRVQAGLEFRQAHAGALRRASQLYGVPEEVIVAIIGVETVYGRNMGQHRVIEALSTLAFDYPPRAAYFRSELEQFLIHAREEGIDALGTRGSYAGAIGIPQFMPGSYRRYAVDFDGDGRRDLAGSPVDAIGSVANFLKEHGWRRGQPIASPAQVTGEAYRGLLAWGIKPAFSVNVLPALGVTPVEALPGELPGALVELQTPGQDAEYWIGLDNFYTITRYNRSSFYAISVIELARAIAQADGADGAAAPPAVSASPFTGPQ